jgi:hypothetical protein
MHQPKERERGKMEEGNCNNKRKRNKSLVSICVESTSIIHRRVDNAAAVHNIKDSNKLLRSDSKHLQSIKLFSLFIFINVLAFFYFVQMSQIVNFKLLNTTLILLRY